MIPNSVVKKLAEILRRHEVGLPVSKQEYSYYYAWTEISLQLESEGEKANPGTKSNSRENITKE